MAEEQKPTEVPTTEVAAETKVEETPAAAAEATTTEAAPAAAPEEAAAATTEAAPAEEAAKKEEEVTPIEAGTLEHKGSNFPKNILYSKKHFWFGSDAIDTKALASFRAEKALATAHHVAAWASETGKGLLLFSEKADKSAPQGAIHLADANEPTTEGANKFYFSAKGLKHTFKAANTAERDNWVNQLKLKIAEAKELVPTVTESENYKKTIESFKPAAKKEEKPAAAAAEPAKEEPATEAAAATEAPAEEAKKVESKEEAKKDEAKPRSASRKRTSIFGSLLGKKEEEKKAAEPTEPAAEAAETTEAPAEAAATEAPAAEATEATDAPATTEAPAATEEPKAEAKDAKASKRASIFGNLLKKKAPEATEAPAAAPAKETPANTEAVAETAPVIPAVETTEPLSTDVTAAGDAAAESADATAAATNGETKKDVRSDKRKSSLPFGLGKKEKSPTSDDEAEKPKSPGPFSKLRATIKGKGKAAPKAEEKAEDKPAEAEAAKEEPIKEETAAPVEAEPATEAAVPAENAVATAPVIPAAA